MLGLAMATALCSIHFCFRRRCTGWRRTCTRCSCRRRGPVLAGQALVVAASEVVADFPAEDSVAGAAAPSERCVGDSAPRWSHSIYEWINFITDPVRCQHCGEESSCQPKKRTTAPPAGCEG